jgi:cytoskeletal protein CcmA (bactofilin family)
MKKITVLFSALMFLIISANTALAVDFYGEEELFLQELSLDDVYAGGALITIDSDVDGDLVIGGGSITINANIKGDLIAAGGQITLNGDVADDVRVAGGSIIINGNIGDDLIASGGQLNVSNNTLIGGSLVFGAGFANVLGTINEDVLGGGGKFILGGNVYRDVTVEIQESLTLTPDASINGNLVYTSLRNAELNEDQVAGFIEHKELAIEEPSFGTDFETMFSRFHLFWQIFMYLTMLVLAIVLVTLLPATLLATTKVCKEHTWRSLGLGFVLWICAIAASIILSITVVGIPLAFILLGLLGITWAFAKVYAAMFIGNLLLKPKKMSKGKLFGIVALGGFIIMVVGMIPVLGWLVCFLVTMIAFGSLWTYKKEIYQKLNLQKF